MASYSVNVTDNGDGSWTLAAVLRGPSTVASGGTSLITNTFVQNSATGALTSDSGFLAGATTTTDGLGHSLRSPGDVLERAKALIALDRSYNG